MPRDKQQRQIKQNCASEVTRVIYSEEEWSGGDSAKRDGKEKADRRGNPAGAIASFQHDKASLCIFIPVDPGDCQKVRHLPGEQDAEKDPAARSDVEIRS